LRFKCWDGYELWGGKWGEKQCNAMLMGVGKGQGGRGWGGHGEGGN